MFELPRKTIDEQPKYLTQEPEWARLGAKLGEMQARELEMQKKMYSNSRACIDFKAF